MNVPVRTTGSGAQRLSTEDPHREMDVCVSVLMLSTVPAAARFVDYSRGNGK